MQLSGAGNWDSVRRVSKSGKTRTKNRLWWHLSNVGCIPSKALLDTSHKFIEAQHDFETHGIKVSAVNIDVPAMIKRKDQVVKQLTSGVAGLLSGNKVDTYSGTGKVTSPETVAVNGPEGETLELKAKHIIIAAGSVPIDIPPTPIDQNTIVDSTGALEFQEVPKRLGVIGAGLLALSWVVCGLASG